ncbi:hypothetical protein GCM10009549_33780 [Streptomyces thermoalcalitolerans]|uniref:Uncharacterized protein n=1 Tax=Streptomyces thermoalcalitolerans TaxID=65605 RepID=A0ABN1NUA4_9ACTN
MGPNFWFGPNPFLFVVIWRSHGPAGIGAGDEVVVPAFGNAEVAEAVIQAAALPVFADIGPAAYCFDPFAVEAAVTSRTAAVVVVQRFGWSADGMGC